MIERYSTKEMSKIWSELTKFTNWAKVEIAVLKAKVKTGYLGVEIPKNLIRRIKISVEEINRIEADVTKHDVIAFLMHTSKQLPENLQPFWHELMTSYDTQDTALSLQLIASIKQLQSRLDQLKREIKKRALEFKYTPQIGRSHGIHAEPITFGVKLANYYAELERHEKRLKRLKKMLAVGKISGAVGMYTLNPLIEETACKILKLKPIISTQIISRDLIAEYITTIAIIGGTLEKIAINLRTMQRTEILEVQEFFDINQRGSSAMPHKKNPIGSENITGLAKVLHGYVIPALENISTWDERDISNSSAERVMLPDASQLLDYMMKRLTNIISKLLVYPSRMRKNLGLTKGLIFSQDVQALVTKKSNLPREKAYGLVRDVALDCWKTGDDFLFTLLQNKTIMSYVNDKELTACFVLDAKLQHVDYIFEKVFGKN
ncbi:MAG: adenylosuccinate lyase [Patescibacteria group bacterium]